MNYSEYAKYCRLMGYRAEETAHGVWIGRKIGFLNRVPAYETAAPSEEELKNLLKKPANIGLFYSLKAGSNGKSSHVYFVRRHDYALENLDGKERRNVRRGLENCQVRRMSFDELHRLGMPLNMDTLARQQRDDPFFSHPDGWAKFCRATEQVEGAEAWGAFVKEELGAYLVFLRLGSIINIMYQMSCNRLLKLRPNRALVFSTTQNMMKMPGVEAVYNGPEWLSTSQELDEYKRRLGFIKEPVVFSVQLKPALKNALLNSSVHRIIDVVGPPILNNDTYRKVQTVLDIASVS